MQRRTKIAVLGAVLLLVTGATGSAAAYGTDSHPRHEAAALTGTAKLYRVAGDDITFSFDAHLAAKDHADPLRATGTFRWSHHAANGEGGGWAKARVDCLVTGGKVAVVSGVITDTDLDGVKGHRSAADRHPGRDDCAPAAGRRAARDRIGRIAEQHPYAGHRHTSARADTLAPGTRTAGRTRPAPTRAPNGTRWTTVSGGPASRPRRLCPGRRAARERIGRIADGGAELLVDVLHPDECAQFAGDGHHGEAPQHQQGQYGNERQCHVRARTVLGRPMSRRMLPLVSPASVTRW